MSAWSGVTLSGGRVTQLNLSNANSASRFLTGKIPPELGDLSSLTHLFLNDNALVGPIPKELGNLSSVSVLRLDSNSLTGPIPKELGSLPNVIQVQLDDNSLTGCIPVDLRFFVPIINPQKNSVNLPVCPGVPVLTLTPGNGEIAASWTAPAGGVRRRATTSSTSLRPRPAGPTRRTPAPAGPATIESLHQRLAIRRSCPGEGEQPHRRLVRDAERDADVAGGPAAGLLLRVGERRQVDHHLQRGAGRGRQPEQRRLHGEEDPRRRHGDRSEPEHHDGAVDQRQNGSADTGGRGAVLRGLHGRLHEAHYGNRQQDPRRQRQRDRQLRRPDGDEPTPRRR